MLPLYLPLSHTGVNDQMLVMYNYKHMITNSLMGKEEVMNHAETEQLDIESSTLRSAKGLEKLRYGKQFSHARGISLFRGFTV